MAEKDRAKKALAEAFKTLLQKKPLRKVTVADICAECKMSRKSFYYHFRDKYDLVCWIFDNEFVSNMKKPEDGNLRVRWDIVSDLAHYFDENRQFYSRVFEYKGQNSFSEHLRELQMPVVRRNLAWEIGDDQVKPFYVYFFTDALMMAFDRWMLDPDPITADDFMDSLTACLLLVQDNVHEYRQELDEEKKK